MSDNPIELSRRKILAGLGTIGAASAGVGLGTSAYFSDEENYENNTLVAGSLDLKVDWEEHYSDWMGEETEHARMPEPGEDPDYILPGQVVDPDLLGFPTQNGAVNLQSPGDSRPIELVFTTSQDDFWDATSIDAYPDDDNDGIQDTDEDDNPVFPEAESICDTDSDLSEALDSQLRTTGSIGEPLINLQDVKPGDFGEVTFSFHLCDNPGYVWLQGELVEASENGVTEPEGKDPDEEEGTVELLDNVLTRIWYDDGNNQVDPITGQLDVVCAIDTSGSLGPDEIGQLETGVNDFIDELGGEPNLDAQVGTVQFGGGSVSVTNTLGNPGSVTVSLPGDGDGNTPMPAALDIADQVVNDTTAGARAGAEKAVVVFTDGGPNYQNTSYTDMGYTAPRDDSTNWSAASGNNAYDEADTASGTVTEDEMDETLLVANSVRNGGTSIATVYVGEDGQDQQAMTQNAIDAYDDLPTYLSGNSFQGIANSPGDAFDVDLQEFDENLAESLVQLITVSEDVFFFGTLRGALAALSADQGIALTGDIPAEDGGGTGRNCFSASNTHHIGFEWWLPVDHANQIQTDSAKFNLGFYTEQCRHNDGSGQAPETTSTAE